MGYERSRYGLKGSSTVMSFTYVPDYIMLSELLSPVRTSLKKIDPEARDKLFTTRRAEPSRGLPNYRKISHLLKEECGPT